MDGIEEFYDNILPPEDDQLIINPLGCVFMNVEMLFKVANDEMRENLLKSGYFTVGDVKNAENDQ